MPKGLRLAQILFQGPRKLQQHVSGPAEPHWQRLVCSNLKIFLSLQWVLAAAALDEGFS